MDEIGRCGNENMSMGLNFQGRRADAAKRDESLPLETARSWNASASQPAYTPQFSTNSSLILSRMNQNVNSLASTTTSSRPSNVPNSGGNAYEDARSSLMQSLNTTLALPHATSNSGPDITMGPNVSLGRDAVGGEALAGNKRKREPEEEGIDFTQNTIAMPSQAQPVTRPQINDQFSSSSASLKAEPLENQDTNLHSDKGADVARLQKIERIRQKRLAALPEGVAPAKPELVGFVPGPASSHTRSEYFQSLKRTDLLNLLSFCDQLRPQLLVDIMVSVSKRHPDLPIFNSPDWDAAISDSLTAGKASHNKQRPLVRTRHGPSLLNSKAKQKIKGNAVKAMAKKPHKRSRLAKELVVEGGAENQAASAEEAAAASAAAAEVEEDPLPPTWPKAGSGLYAKLIVETQDRAFLADENDEEAFSHFMVDKLGRQIVDPV